MALKPVETITYVYGAAVNTMDKPSLVEALKRVVAEKQALVKGLEDVESSYIRNQVAELEAAQQKILGLLDA
jgi:hypothetical protein